jgi:alkanesulfonate monooxygenase SsuD/methylene tetrahydromethanopterin reductase-like flavin-dependent oxidoreductase (luciferase family)
MLGVARCRPRRYSPTGIPDPDACGEAANSGQFIDVLMVWSTKVIRGIYNRNVVKSRAELQFNFYGEFWQLRGTAIDPKPFQKPHPPLWFGAVGEANASFAY